MLAGDREEWVGDLRRSREGRHARSTRSLSAGDAQILRRFRLRDGRRRSVEEGLGPPDAAADKRATGRCRWASLEEVLVASARATHTTAAIGPRLPIHRSAQSSSCSVPMTVKVSSSRTSICEPSSLRISTP